MRFRPRRQVAAGAAGAHRGLSAFMRLLILDRPSLIASALVALPGPVPLATVGRAAPLALGAILLLPCSTATAVGAAGAAV